MNLRSILPFVILAAHCLSALAAEPPATRSLVDQFLSGAAVPAPPAANKTAPLATQQTSPAAGVDGSSYHLSPNDVLEIKVYREPDLDTKVRIAKDGTGTFPLIGTLRLGGKTVDQATTYIRDLLEADYIVNPQVTVHVVEYSKRRFTILGQLQKPGAYEIPNEERVTLLQAVAMAGGFTRMADTSHISVKRSVQGREMIFNLNARAMAKNRDVESFEIFPDDTITVGERIF